MTYERVKELHKRFIPGITGWTIIIVGGALISGSFYARGQFDMILQSLKDNRVHADSLSIKSHYEIGDVRNALVKKIDSLQNYNELQFQEIRLQFESKGEYYKSSTQRLYTEKWINGKLKIILLK